MNVVGKISLGLAAALVVSPVAPAAVPAPAKTARMMAASEDVTPADVSAASDRPYGTIVARNIFGLVAIPPPAPPPPPPEDPPPKITANGIMDVFGQLQALFKVAVPAKGKEPAKDHSYMLSEGQRQDDIEVTKIDEKAATITFNNHGTIQEIPLAPASGSGSSPSTEPSSPMPNGIPPPLPARFRNRPGIPGGGFPGGFGGGGIPGGQNPSPAQNNNNNNSSIPGLNGGGGSVGGSISTAQQGNLDSSSLTPEQQAILVETERAALLSSEKPEYPPNLLPPTKLTPSDETGEGAVEVPPAP